MSSRTFLVGGGWDAPEVYEPFLRMARERSGGVPRVGCMIIDEGDGPAQFERYAQALRKTGVKCAPVALLVPLGGRFERRPRWRGWTGCWCAAD